MKMTPKERAIEAMARQFGDDEDGPSNLDLEERIEFQINEAVLEEREANFKLVAAAIKNERMVEKHYDQVPCLACKETGRITPMTAFEGPESELLFKHAQGICFACNGRGHQTELRCSK